MGLQRRGRSWGKPRVAPPKQWFTHFDGYKANLGSMQVHGPKIPKARPGAAGDSDGRGSKVAPETLTEIDARGVFGGFPLTTEWV